MSGEPLKAYEVREDVDATIVFATNSAAARRDGASDLDTEWECIESCRRAPKFDHYAPGPVPNHVLVEHGWRFECCHCGCEVSDDTAGTIARRGEFEIELKPQYEGDHVYCSAMCAAIDAANRRANNAAKAALLELFAATFPDATARSVHVSGPRLEDSATGHRGRMACVDFTFPGAKYGATYVYGDPDAYVAQIDVESFARYRYVLPGPSE